MMNNSILLGLMVFLSCSRSAKDLESLNDSNTTKNLEKEKTNEKNHTNSTTKIKESATYEITTLRFRFSSNEVFWPDLKKRLEATIEKSKEEWRNGLEESLKPYTQPKTLGSALCLLEDLKTCETNVAKIVGEKSLIQCLIENTCDSVGPFTTTIDGVEKKVIGVRGGNGVFVVQNAKAFHIIPQIRDKVETLSLKVLGNASWGGSCRDLGGHCDPIETSSTDFIHFFDTTDLGSIEILKDELTVQIPVSALKVSFEFSDTTSSACNIKEIVSWSCASEEYISITTKADQEIISKGEIISKEETIPDNL